MVFIQHAHQALPPANPPVVLLDLPFVVGVPHIGAQTQHISRCRGLHVTVTQKGEPVLVSVLNIVVFEARVFDRLEEVDRL